MTGAEAAFPGGFSSSFGTAGAVDSFIGLVYRHGKDITVTPEQGVTVRHGPYPVGPSLHPTSTWKNTESGSITFVVISKDRHNPNKTVTNVPDGTPRLKRSGKMQSQAEANAAAYHDKHSRIAKDWTVIPVKVSWDVMIVRWAYVDKVLADKQGVLESSYSSIARYQKRLAADDVGSEAKAKLEVEIGRFQRQMFAVREEMRGILAFRGMFEGIVVMFNCRVMEKDSWGGWTLNSPQNCVVKMGFKIHTNEKNGHTGVSIRIRFEEKVTSWTRLKTGKLEIHDGIFKSFSGNIFDDEDKRTAQEKLTKVSNPMKTYAESIPAPRTAGLEYIYGQSSSWRYLDRVAKGEDPDISADAGPGPRSAQSPAAAPPVKVGPQRSRSQADLSGAPSKPTVRRTRSQSGNGGHRRRRSSGDLDHSDIMQEIGASPKNRTSSGNPKAKRSSAKPDVRRDSRAKIEPAPISSSTDPATGPDPSVRPTAKPRTPSGPKLRSGARVRTKGDG